MLVRLTYKYNGKIIITEKDISNYSFGFPSLYSEDMKRHTDKSLKELVAAGIVTDFLVEKYENNIWTTIGYEPIW